MTEEQESAPAYSAAGTASAGGPAADSGAAERGAGRNGVTKRRRVLLVDDSEDATFVMGQLLEMRGFEISSAQTGADAIELAAREKPDAVVLDLGLPDMDGFEVLAKLKQLEGLAHTRFIALTGRDPMDEQAQLREVGFDDHFVKPADMDRLIAAINRS